MRLATSKHGRSTGCIEDTAGAFKKLPPHFDDDESLLVTKEKINGLQKKNDPTEQRDSGDRKETDSMTGHGCMGGKGVYGVRVRVYCEGYEARCILPLYEVLLIHNGRQVNNSCITRVISASACLLFRLRLIQINAIRWKHGRMEK
ncbi:hypothetical protein J6590_019232 [Homalodisca vitripennis]|nr:hypothetical protein J6590_019232 [Homalodisca vitripennis]